MYSSGRRDPMCAQYKTPFTCPDFQEHVFETEAKLLSEQDLIGALCTNCGHELTEDEIGSQVRAIPGVAMQNMIANAQQL